MEQVPWSEDEWAALTQSDMPPTVPVQPWGAPMSRQTVQDMDYAFGKTMQMLMAKAGPLGLAYNLLAPNPQPGSATMRTVDQGLDYLGWLAPLLGLYSSRPLPQRGPTSWKTQQTPVEQARDMAKQPPWGSVPPPVERTWDWRRVPKIGGPTGKGKSLEEILRHRAPLEMDDDVLEAMIAQMRKQWDQSPLGPFKLPPLPGE